MSYYIISVHHTHRSDPYITLWRPDDRGYSLATERAGRYAEEHVLGRLGYYNSGCSNVAVRCDVLDKVSVPVKAGMIDGDAGQVVLNTAKNWKLIVASLIRPPREAPKPQYKGAPRLAV